MNQNKRILLGLAFLLLAFCQGTLAQNDNAEFANGFPVAPTGLENLPLGNGPWEFRTGEAMNIHVELVAHMAFPMAMSFMPDESILIVTRPGKLMHLKKGKMAEVKGTPESRNFGESGGIGTIHGYMDVTLHPDFAANGYVYLMYTRPDANLPGVLTVGRGKWAGDSLENFQVIFDTEDLTGAGRIQFGSDGKLYMSTPDRDAQDLSSLGGKVLRLNADGSVPSDNPFLGKPKARPEIYTYGNRSIIGLSVYPGTGQLWASENGPNGGDEINILRAGTDYGWPAVSLGRDYTGPWHGGHPGHAGYADPVVYWMPAVAVSGLTFYTGDKLSKWTGDLFVGAMREGEVNGTGHLERVLFNDKMEELRRESLLTTLHKRIRDVVQGPDEYLYVVLEERDGGILRIMPAE
ncbi:MAG: PQQ-dependent sugar dehydrogenase [Pseudomonadales bacterium]|nr:PQQ-dependent sugar dehydrogenase [Pseudomonadales bacterium]